VVQSALPKEQSTHCHKGTKGPKRVAGLRKVAGPRIQRTQVYARVHGIAINGENLHLPGEHSWQNVGADGTPYGEKKQAKPSIREGHLA
jgi:hypothetical protein